MAGICKSDIFFPYRHTACLKFDTAWQTVQEGGKVEVAAGFRNANSKLEYLLDDNNIYSKQLLVSMQAIQDAGMGETRA